MTAGDEAREVAALRYLLRRAARAEWEADALCKELGSRLFYVESIEGTQANEPVWEAIRACGLCPVMAECRARALVTGEKLGVWGGMSEVRRKEVLAEGPEAVREALLDALSGEPPTLRRKPKVKAADSAEDSPVHRELEAA